MNRSENRPEAPMSVSEDLVPIAELKTHLSERIRSLRERGRPLVVTQHGKAAAVLLSPEDFDRLTARARFVASIETGLADAKAGRTLSDAELEHTLDAALPRRTRKR